MQLKVARLLAGNRFVENKIETQEAEISFLQEQVETDSQSKYQAMFDRAEKNKFLEDCQIKNMNLEFDLASCGPDGKTKSS